MYSTKQKKQLLEKINNLTSTEHEEIFNIILRSISDEKKINYTTNKNGVFFNLSTLEEATIDEIEKFVDFCYANKKDLDEYDKRLNECKATTNIINLNLETIVEKKGCDTALPICDWNTINIDQTLDNKQTQSIVNFIERLHSDKSGKKKLNVKFHNAKKKYAKKVVSDAKFEYDLLSELCQEEYLLKD